jgi:hypothetical protein
VGEGGSLRGTKIAATTLAAYLTAAIFLLKHHGMDDPRRLTRPGQPRQNPHPPLACVIDHHKLMCLKHRMRHPITSDMIDIMLWIDNHAPSTDAFEWITSRPVRYNWMILGFITGYRIDEYGQTDNSAFGKCVRGARGSDSRLPPEFHLL